MLRLVVAALGLAGIAMSKCTSVSQVDGMTSALCVDDDTGMEFEYMDMRNDFPIPDGSVDLVDTVLLDNIYQTYLGGSTERMTSNVTTSIDAPDSLKAFFTVCGKHIAGVCSNTHVIAWTGTTAAFATGVAQIVTTVNGKRENQSPRSKCVGFGNNGTICVSWALYEFGKATDDQVKAMSNHCAETCQENGWSCEARLLQGDKNTAEYFCVSNRADGCTANHQLDNRC